MNFFTKQGSFFCGDKIIVFKFQFAIAIVPKEQK
jgi:hypothetical protein